MYCGDHCDAKLCRGPPVLVWISCEDDRCQEEVEDSSATTSLLSFFVAIFHIEVVGYWPVSMTMYCCRFIYWNSHFYGSNFYGWSIGDIKSLSESGPFHSQGDYADSWGVSNGSKQWNYHQVCGSRWLCVGCLLALTWDKTFPISSATPAPVPARRGAALFSCLRLGVYIFIGVHQRAENGLKFLYKCKVSENKYYTIYTKRYSSEWYGRKVLRLSGDGELRG